jgi:hypothetical protein
MYYDKQKNIALFYNNVEIENETKSISSDYYIYNLNDKSGEFISEDNIKNDIHFKQILTSIRYEIKELKEIYKQNFAIAPNGSFIKLKHKKVVLTQD